MKTTFMVDANTSLPTRRQLSWALNETKAGLDNAFLRSACIAVVMLVAAMVLFELAAGYLEYRTMISKEDAAVFRLSKDGSIGEWLGYGFTALAAVFAALAGLRLNSPVHAMTASSFVFIMLDDMNQWHERMGDILGYLFFASTTFVRPQDLGEMSYLLVAGGAMILVLISAFSASHVKSRALSLMFLLPLALLGGAAIGLDMAHAMVPAESRLLAGLVATLEDGTELLALGLLMLTALSHWILVRNDGAQPQH